MLIKLKIHSIVDLITNSSTTIYTYCNSCPKSIIDLIEVIGKTFGINERAEDMFYINTFCSVDEYTNYLDELDLEDTNPEDYPEFIDLKVYDELDWKESRSIVDNLVKDILTGKVKKPEWMVDVEENENYSGLSPSTELFILTKDDKYNELAEALKRLINSQDHEAIAAY